nr:bifunctional diguanylate cyclase/phosphodiesterase [Persephonella atlantica]
MNRENIFFKSISSVAKSEVSFLTVINVRNLGIINKFYGKEVGDSILDSIHKRLSVILSTKNNIFIRGSSGEFYILHRKKPENPEEFGKRLKEEIEQIKIKADIEVRFNVSVAVLEIGGLTEIKELNRIISHAVQKAKESEEGVVFFNKDKIREEFSSEIKKIYKDVATIKKAFREKSIDLFFQPIFNIKTGKLEHLEALARIKQEDRYIPAGAFIDLIYSMNLIKELDSAVLSKTAEYAKNLKSITDRLFINVSFLSISSSDFINMLIKQKEKLEQEGIDMIIELTEQSLLENIELIKFLKNRYDLTFAVDDFGIGYSSIRTVYDLSDVGAIRYLKIDGSLIKNIHTSERNIKPVETIVNFAKTLNLKVIAEYVENEKILKRLESLSVDYGQGFYLSKPSHIKELLKWKN